MSNQDLTDQFLDHLHRGGEWAHYWTPDTGEFYTDKRTGEQKQKSWSQWFEVGKRPPVHSAWINKNVYFPVNPVSAIPTTYSDGSPVQQRVYTKTRSNLVCAINAVFSEFDVKDWGDAESIKDHMWELPIYPTALIHSGGGFHGYWFLDNTISVDDTNRRYIQQVQTGWVDVTGGDKNAKDIAHVFRVPGFKNFKPRYAPDYPIVYFADVDFDRLYTFAQIEELTAHLRKGKEPRQKKQRSDNDNTVGGDLITAIDALKRLSTARCDDYNGPQ